MFAALGRAELVALLCRGIFLFGWEGHGGFLSSPFAEMNMYNMLFSLVGFKRNLSLLQICPGA